MVENHISNITIGCAIDVHRSLGPGLLESAYWECLRYDLANNGLLVESEKPMPIVYKEMKLRNYKLGLLLNFRVRVLKNGIKRIIN